MPASALPRHRRGQGNAFPDERWLCDEVRAVAVEARLTLTVTPTDVLAANEALPE